MADLFSRSTINPPSPSLVSHPMIDDSDVLRRVDTALRQHPHLRSALIAPRQADDSVVLEGSVESFFIKQMAQEAIRPIAGGQRIDNRLQVRSTAET